MSDLNKILKEEYDKKKNTITTQSLMEMIEEMMHLQEAFGLVVEEEPRTVQQPREAIKIEWSGIPEIPVSELGWGSPDREGEGDNPRREQLSGFLQSLIPAEATSGWGTLRETLKKLQAYFPRTSSQEYAQEKWPELASVETETNSRDLKKALQFLIFYKALTEIMINFNESAAGFSFESFLAVLLGGTQVPTGTGTIADLVDNQGVPISLKLLRETTAQVGGSYSDLVRDLVGAAESKAENYKMNYLVCLKTIRGEGLDARGAIRFYEYWFNNSNFIKMMNQGKTKEYLKLARVNIDGTPRILVFKDDPKGLGYYDESNKFIPLNDEQRGSLMEAAAPAAADDATTPSTINIGDVAVKYQKVVADNIEKIKREAPHAIKIQMGRATAGRQGAATTRNLEPALQDLKKALESIPRIVSVSERQEVSPTVEGFLNAALQDDVIDIIGHYIDNAYYAKDKPTVVPVKDEKGAITGYTMEPKMDPRLRTEIFAMTRLALKKYMQGQVDNIDQVSGWSDIGSTEDSWTAFLHNYGPAGQKAYNAATRKAAINAVKKIPQIIWSGLTGGISNVIAGFYTTAMSGRTETNIAYQGFADVAESVRILELVRSTEDNDIAFANTLRLTYGYAKTKNWHFSKAQLNTGMEGQPNWENEGYMGTLYVGQQNVINFAQAIAVDSNRYIFDVFKSLKKMTTEIEKFYNTGLEEKHGSAAITAGEEVENNIGCAMNTPGAICDIKQAAE